MELLYEVTPDLDGAEDYVVSNKRIKLNPERHPILSVSVGNLVAFSSNVDLTLNKNGKRSLYSGSGAVGVADDEQIAGCHVYITDLNTPWEIFLIKNSSFQATHLQWDHQGTKLLMAFENGNVQVYTMVDNLLNKWLVNYEANFPGEPILCSAWLNVPRKITVNPEKLDSMVYSEKYQTGVPYSSIGFGGKALEGFVLVTATGLLGAVVNTCGEDGERPVTTSEKMTAIRSHIMFADMIYSNDGDILVVTCNENMKQPVLVNKINILMSGYKDKVEIKAKASQSLFLNNLLDFSISSVQFMNKSSTDHLLISMTNKFTGSSWLCIYELVVQPITLKSRFQTSTSDVFNTFRWQQTSQIQFGSSITSLCTLGSPLISNGSSSSLMQNSSQNQQTTAVLTPLVATTLSNGSVVLSRCDNLQQVSTFTSQSSSQSSLGVTVKLEKEDDSPPKCKLSSSKDELIVCISFTWSGSILLALTSNSHLYAYKVHPNIDASTSALVLEMSMVSGLDPWDIMMNIKSGLIDNITDRLSETFARQPPPAQTHYNAKVLVIKAALYRMSSSGTARINDQQTLLVLYLVSGALKALLRPAELSSREKGPAESLSSLLSSSGEQYADLNKVLVQMAATEYAVEAPTLQSIQQFMQWCADLALKLLSTLPDLRHSRAPGWEVCRDSKAVGTLRELIVLMRIWGLQRPSCLPAFRKTSENLDVLPLLFRLLTRLSVAPHDPDESLIDECCLLPSEVQIPHHTAYCPTKSLGMSSSILFSRGCPQQFQFGVLPLKWWVGVETNGNWMDGLRLLWLGKNPAGVKICNRCGCTTLLNLPPRSTANKAWDQRWLRTCPCGGHWKIPAFLPQPKVHDVDFLNHL